MPNQPTPTSRRSHSASNKWEFNPGDSRGSVSRGFAMTLVLALMSSASLFSQPSRFDDAPLTHRPDGLDATNFFNARGSSVKAAWSVNRTSVPEDGELTAVLTIKGAENPQRIVRPDLKKLPEFQTRFVIADKKDTEPSEAAKEVKFSYQFRPRNRLVDKIPSFDFYYYNPAAPTGKSQFPKTVATRVDIKVTEAPKKELPPVPLMEPDELFVTTTGPQLLERRQAISTVWPWLAVGLAGPLSAFLWFLIWQRLFPDARRVASMRRSKAARRALDAIHRSGKANDPAAAIALAVLGYLRARLPLSPGASTPSEIAVALGELRIAEVDCATVAEFFRACDAARFAPRDDHVLTLGADAEALITRLEAA
jgi:hypothetical protein